MSLDGRPVVPSLSSANSSLSHLQMRCLPFSLGSSDGIATNGHTYSGIGKSRFHPKSDVVIYFLYMCFVFDDMGSLHQRIHDAPARRVPLFRNIQHIEI